jgi:hypothetical protein
VQLLISLRSLSSKSPSILHKELPIATEQHGHAMKSSLALMIKRQSASTCVTGFVAQSILKWRFIAVVVVDCTEAPAMSRKQFKMDYKKKLLQVTVAAISIP